MTKMTFESDAEFNRVYEDCLEEWPDTPNELMRTQGRMYAEIENYMEDYEKFVFRYAYECGYNAGYQAGIIDGKKNRE